MIELTDLTLTALWHDANLISVRFTWAADGEITGTCLTLLNPEEDITPLVAFGLTSRRVIIYFRKVNDVQTVLHSNYAAIPTIDDWAANRSTANECQRHTITTVSGCRFCLESQSVWLQAPSNP
jgi:hypothetical protein